MFLFQTALGGALLAAGYGLTTLVMQLLGFLVLFPVLKKKPFFDGGWAFGRVLFWLIAGFLIWVFAHLRVPMNSLVGFWLVMLGLGVLAWKNFTRHQKAIRSFFKEKQKTLILAEIIFLFGFVFLVVIRGFNPDVLDLEKFMDAGLMQAYLRSPTLPLEDMWLAGEKINYYTFGHFLGSLLLRFWGTPIEVGYNLALGWIMGLVLVQSFAVVGYLLQPFIEEKQPPKQRFFTFIQKPVLVAGVLALLLMGFGGNTHPIWHVFQNHSFQQYWYPDATRFIERTIHEFPAYSFVVSDLHAHVWSLPIVLLGIVILWEWYKTLHNLAKKYLKIPWKDSELLADTVVAGSLFGVLAMTSTWDMLVYGFLLVVLGVLTLIQDWKKIWVLGFSALIMAASGAIVASFWLAFFTSISQGVFLVYETSPLWQLGALWLGHVMLSLIALGVAITLFFRRAFDKKRRKLLLFPMALVVTAWLLLVLPEVIYFKDIYPNHPRANTMFKLTFQAFVMMSLMGAWALGILQSKVFSAEKWQARIFKGVIFFFSIGFLLYPFQAYPGYYHDLKEYRGRDGLRWLETDFPGEREAIEWFRANTSGRPIILEAVGESYTKHARFSTFTGLPTVLGWRVHEWLWRGGFDIPRERTAEVKTVYENPNSLAAKRILDQYQVEYLVIGELEREAYPTLNEFQLRSLGDVVFRNTGVIVIHRQLR